MRCRENSIPQRNFFLQREFRRELRWSRRVASAMTSSLFRGAARAPATVGATWQRGLMEAKAIFVGGDWPNFIDRAQYSTAALNRPRRCCSAAAGCCRCTVGHGIADLYCRYSAVLLLHVTGERRLDRGGRVAANRNGQFDVLSAIVSPAKTRADHLK